MSNDDERIERSPPSNEQVNDAFHKLWTKAVGQPDYDKSEWKELARLLTARGIPV